VFLTIAALGLAAWGGWRWWTAPPSASAEGLVGAAALAPDDADGVLVLGAPARTARWLTTRPQSLALLLIAAPRATRTLARLQPVARAVVEAAHGPVVFWWKGDAAVVAAATSTEGLNALRRVAELRGLSFDGADGIARFATTPGLLHDERHAAPPRGIAGRFALLAYVHGRWWTGEATRDSLAVRAGARLEPGEISADSRLETADVAAFAATLSLPIEPFHGPACIAFARGQGWGLALPAARLPEAVRAALGGRFPRPAGVAGAERWDGLLGTLYVAPHAGVTVASDLSRLAAVVDCPGMTEQGCLHGADLAWAATRLANAADALTLLGARVEGLRRAAPLLAALARVRWRVTPRGGVIALEW
jgi:hypothetical protein